MTWLAHSLVEDLELQRFDQQADRIEQAIRDRMAAYEQVLRGGQGLFASGLPISRQAFRRYVAQLALSTHYPGIQGVGYAVMLQPDRVNAFEARLRQEGFAEFSVHPSGERSVYSAIEYLEPFDWRNRRAFGFDMYSEPTRREAMQRAIDTGTSALSGRVVLVQETGNDTQAGFLMYLPVYRNGDNPSTAEERREQIQGFVYSPFRAADLMRGIVGVRPQVDFAVFDGPDAAVEHLLYRSFDAPSDGTRRSDHQERRLIDVAGRTWHLQLNSSAQIRSIVESNLSAAVLIGGLLLSALLYLLVDSMANGRVKAQRLADAMTMDLRRSEAEKSRLNDELHRSNAELEQFAHVASHDLQTPLRTVGSYTQLLLRRLGDNSDPDIQEFGAFIVSGVHRMQALIQDLLEYARLDGESGPKRAVPLQQLVERCAQDLEADISDAGIELEIGPLPVVLGDPGQLERVFSNLLSNAVKYRNAPRPKIEVRAKTGKNACTQIEVRDNGIGIGADESPKLFKMFSRLHDQSQYPGTGMGLAICKRIISQHQGEIWVEPNPGGGSRFCLTLPLAQDALPTNG